MFAGAGEPSESRTVLLEVQLCVSTPVRAWPLVYINPRLVTQGKHVEAELVNKRLKEISEKDSGNELLQAKVLSNRAILLALQVRTESTLGVSLFAPLSRLRFCSWWTAPSQYLTNCLLCRASILRQRYSISSHSPYEKRCWGRSTCL